jgi:hypothetical protein
MSCIIQRTSGTFTLNIIYFNDSVNRTGKITYQIQPGSYLEPAEKNRIGSPPLKEGNHPLHRWEMLGRKKKAGQKTQSVDIGFTLDIIKA